MSALSELDWTGIDPSTAADVERMRRDRGERLRAMMADAGIDALILLGNANVSYATGATWLLSDAGRANVERPVAVVLVDDPVPHLFTPFLADAAAELGLDDDHLHGPPYLDLAEGVEAFARRFAVLVPHTATVAVDEVTSAMRYLDADIVDAGPALRSVRRIKTDDEVVAIRGAIEIADAAMTSAVAELRPGVTERELTSAVLQAMAVRGGAPRTMQDVVRITSSRDRGTGPARDEVWAGDLVALHAAAVAGGYIGEVGRTWPVGEGRHPAALTDAYRRSAELWARLLEACQPGAPASALLDAYGEAGEPLPVMPVGRGLGLGFDDPVIARHLPETAAIERLDPGVVLVVTACVFDDVVGSVISREAVRITADGPDVLSSSPSWTRAFAGAHA